MFKVITIIRLDGLVSTERDFPDRAQAMAFAFERETQHTVEAVKVQFIDAVDGPRDIYNFQRQQPQKTCYDR